MSFIMDRIVFNSMFYLICTVNVCMLQVAIDSTWAYFNVTPHFKLVTSWLVCFIFFVFFVITNTINTGTQQYGPAKTYSAPTVNNASGPHGTARGPHVWRSTGDHA